MIKEHTTWEYLAWELKNHLIEMGKLKIDLSNFPAALVDLDKAIDVYPKDAFIFIKNGKDKEINRDLRGAIDDYDRAIKFSLIYIYRGYVKSRVGDIEGAVKDYEKAESLKRKYHYVYFLRARMKEINKNFKGALRDYDDAIRFNKKKNKKLFAKRASINIEIGDHQAAIKDLNKAINFFPNVEKLYLERGRAKIGTHELKSSITDFNKAIEINPKSGLAYFNRGLVKKLSANDYGSIQSKIKFFKESCIDLEKAIDILGAKYEFKIGPMITENKEAIKVINENIF